MEADWEVDVGGGAPVIEADWAGYVDLRRSPERARELMEVGQMPGLAAGLVRLNAAASPVWTSKCDVWVLETFDADEMDAPIESAVHALACYIDLLPKSCLDWRSHALAADWCRNACTRVRAFALRGCRVDLVVRCARFAADEAGFGVTAYLSAAGSDPAAAARVLAAALAGFADSVVQAQSPAAGA